MRVRFKLTLWTFTTLAFVLAACAGEGDGINVTETTTVAAHEATIEVDRDTSTEEDSTTSASIASEVCRDKISGASMSYEGALAIAESSQCMVEGQLLENHFCNENSGTWWIDLAVDKAGCNPACVINVNSGEVEINWRCTGALPPSDTEPTEATSAMAPAPAPSVFDYTDWGTYANEIHGYELKYPTGVEPLWDDEAKGVTFQGPLEENEHWPMFFVGHPATEFYRPPVGTSVREWVQSTSGQPESNYSEDTELAGLEAYHVVKSRSPQSYASDQYYFIKDGQMFSIVILHAGDRQDWRMYEQFLQSFTFPPPAGQRASESAAETVRGIVGANPPGSQSRYYLDSQDGQRWILGTSDEALWAAIADAAWRGIEVKIIGNETPLPGLIDVSNIEFLGEPAVEPRNLSHFAQPSASSVLPADRLGTYHEWSAIDGRLESPWCEGADGAGADEWLRLDFASPVEATMIRMSNGYDYSDDIFEKNNRVKKATFVFSDGETIDWVFDDSRGLQSVPLARAPGPNIMTTSVRVKIEEVYPGSIYDDTCIAELEIWGRPQ